MHHSIEKLLNGDTRVVECFSTANEKWPDLFDAKRDEDIESWASWLTDNQIAFFERQCGGRDFGQEVMAWSGFGYLYSTQTGFEENAQAAKKLAEAFEHSMVSLEVKSMARDAAKSYLG